MGKAITKLLDNPKLAYEMGQAEEKIEEQYSLQVWGPRVVKLFQSLLLESAIKMYLGILTSTFLLGQ